MTETEEKLLIERYGDLQIQAEMFGLDIDIEAMTLVPKRVDNRPAWAKAWSEKRSEGDFDELMDIDLE